MVEHAAARLPVIRHAHGLPVLRKPIQRRS
jgi:hypothetical protein